MTFFTSLTRRPFPFCAEGIFETNTGVDFMAAVINALEDGFFDDGDYFVVDGARVHFSADTIVELTARLRAAGVCLDHCISDST